MRKSAAEFRQTYTGLEIHVSWQKILDKRAHPPAQPSSLPPLFIPNVMACPWTWGLAGRNEHTLGLQTTVQLILSKASEFHFVAMAIQGATQG